jgi:hypothetical protein
MSNVCINLASVVTHVDEQISAVLEDEIVVLKTTNSTYYGLSGISAFIWSSIAKTGTVSAIVEAVLDNYEVSRECCEEDVLSFLRELSDAGLIRIIA